MWVSLGVSLGGRATPNTRTRGWLHWCHLHTYALISSCDLYGVCAGPANAGEAPAPRGIRTAEDDVDECSCSEQINPEAGLQQPQAVIQDQLQEKR